LREACQLLFDTRWLPLATNRPRGAAGEHGPHMRLNPRRLGFRDQLLGFFARILCALTHQCILPNDGNYSHVLVCIPEI
jgi:hypothetical protein